MLSLSCIFLIFLDNLVSFHLLLFEILALKIPVFFPFRWWGYYRLQYISQIGSSLKYWHVLEVVIIWDIFQIRVRIVFWFTPWRGVDCTWFSRSYLGLKICTEESYAYLSFLILNDVFVSSFLLFEWHSLHWVYYCVFLEDLVNENNV